jgi:hypothetical protein
METGSADINFCLTVREVKGRKESVTFPLLYIGRLVKFVLSPWSRQTYRVYLLIIRVSSGLVYGRKYVREQVKILALEYALLPFQEHSSQKFIEFSFIKVGFLATK